MVATTISGMFKIGGSAKTVFSSLLFTQLDYVELVIFVLGSLLIMRASSLVEQNCYSYQIAKFLHLDDDAKIITTMSAIFSSSGSVMCLTDSSHM